MVVEVTFMKMFEKSPDIQKRPTEGELGLVVYNTVAAKPQWPHKETHTNNQMCTSRAHTQQISVNPVPGGK